MKDLKSDVSIQSIDQTSFLSGVVAGEVVQSEKKVAGFHLITPIPL